MVVGPLGRLEVRRGRPCHGIHDFSERMADGRCQGPGDALVRALSADHLVHGELLDVWWTLRLDSRRRHPFHDPWSEGVEVSA